MINVCLRYGQQRASAPKTLTCSKILNLLKHVKFIPHFHYCVKSISMPRYTIHASSVKIGPVIVYSLYKGPALKPGHDNEGIA